MKNSRNTSLNKVLPTGMIIILISFTLMMTSCTNKVNTNTTNSSLPYDAEMEFKYLSQGIAAENDRFELAWDSDYMRPVLTDKETQREWSTTPSAALGARLDEEGYPKVNHPQLNSPILVEYIDPEFYDVKVSSAYIGSITGGYVSAEQTDNGIKAVYAFPELEISVPVEYILRDSGMLIKVDPDEIRENLYKVCRITIAPFMCSLENTSEGYLLYPSGSGALIYPRSIDTLARNFSQEVYGEDAARYKEYLQDPVSEESIRMPVFGCKDKDAGIFAIIESGAESASIEASVGSSNIGFTTVNAVFSVRGYEWIDANYRHTKMHQEDKVAGVFAVGFYPLHSDSADYSGMAKIYRKYIESKYDITEKTEDSPAAIKFLGGVNIRNTVLGVPYDDFYELTTLSQTREILEEIAKETGIAPVVDIAGFGRDGLDVGRIADGYKVNSKLGGLRGLNDLTEYAQNSGMKLYMDFDLISFKEASNGFFLISDRAVNTTGRATAQYYYSVWSRQRNSEFKPYYILARDRLSDAAEKLITKIPALGISGIAMDSLSTLCYSDNDSKQYYVKSGMPGDVTAIIHSISETGTGILTNGSNDYAAANSDIIMDIPLKDSGFEYFDETIPFYAMVFKGLIPIYSASLNLASDPMISWLRSIESGAGLGFTFTANHDTKLISSSQKILFGTRYEDNKGIFYEKVSEFRGYYQLIKDAGILKHEILGDGIRKTEFDNGTTVYTNFTAEEKTVGSETLKPYGYLLTQEERP